jgi:hypothetical protein
MYKLAREVLLRESESEGAMQYRGPLLPVPAIILALTFSGATSIRAFQGDTTKKEQKQEPKADAKQQTSALTGCVDEQEGRYVMIDSKTMAAIATLEADGFPTEGFAKHMGQTVTVRGTSSSNGARPTFKVRSIETLSESCGPH